MGDRPATRRLWVLAEHVHAAVYFAPEARAAYEPLGLHGFWRGYFAGRAAPMGAVGRGTVEATFYGFHPDFVARRVPEVWETASPAAVLVARSSGVSAALAALFSDVPVERVEDAADRLLDAMAGCSRSGRPLFAANAELEVPDDPLARLWHGTTLWREHRGDGHIAVLVSEGIDGCASHVFRLAREGGDATAMQQARGWSDDDWHEAEAQLVGRGLLDADGSLTDGGVALAESIEQRTERAASEPVERIGPDGVAELERALRPLAARVAASGLLPHPNPIGVGELAEE